MKDQYFVFTIEPLHLFQLDHSKNLKECITAYLSAASKYVLSSPGWIRNEVFFCKLKFLHGCINQIYAVERDFTILLLYVDFLTSQKSYSLNEFFFMHGC